MELLRILCIFGIVCMHSLGGFLTEVNGLMLVYIDIVNTIFNTGVSIFVLISGYYGIKGEGRKLLSLWLQVFVYSLLGYLVMVSENGVSLFELAKSFLPILTNKYWFVSAYFLLSIFAPYLNMAAEKMSHRSFVALLGTMFLVFSILPTFLWFGFQGTGKGILQFLMMYMIGRYIAIYCKEETVNIKAVGCITIAAQLIIFTSGLVISYPFLPGFISPMARDCSVFIVVSAIGIFLYFRTLRFQSRAVNFISRHVLSVYLLDGVIRFYLNKHIPLRECDNIYLFPLALVGYVLSVMLIAICVDVVRFYVQSFVEPMCWKLLEKCCMLAKKYVLPLLCKKVPFLKCE